MKTQKDLVEFMKILDKKYFKDMRFEPKELKNELIESNLPLPSKGLTGWSIEISSIFYDRQTTGECNGVYKQIRLARKILTKDIMRQSGLYRKHAWPLVLMHEMIHAYEYFYFDKVDKKVRKIVAYSDPLFKHLFKKVTNEKNKRNLNPGKLHKMIQLNKERTIKDYSSHNGLFLLKSIDLDIKLDLPFGYVFGMGREYFFAKFSRLEKKGAN